MAAIDNLLLSTVTYQDHVWSTDLKIISIGEFLNQIKEGHYNNKIAELRNYLKKNDNKRYDQEKIRLPSVTFSGLFSVNRRIETIQKYTGICVIDIDHVSEEKSKEIYKNFCSDPYTFAYWRSPSGKGIKGLVKFDYGIGLDISNIYLYHNYAFYKLHDYMKERYDIEIDKSGSDITRLCFISSDMDLTIKQAANEFKIDNGDITIKMPSQIKTTKDRKNNYFVLKEHLNSAGRNLKRTQIQGFIKYLRNRNLSITNTYEKWYRVAYAISNTFTYDLGEKYFLQLCRLDGPRHDEEKSIAMLQYCYVNSKSHVSFGTIKFYFNQCKEEWGSRTE
ncbi:MAG: hypothetical protein LBK08_12375 [Treponema sp.]|jgi:hypothetical protein|nr:hypothetical protein [Treponema sp.]